MECCFFLTNEQNSLSILKSQIINDIRVNINNEKELISFILKNEDIEMPLNLKRMTDSVTELESLIVAIEATTTIEEYLKVSSEHFKKASNPPRNKKLEKEPEVAAKKWFKNLCKKNLEKAKSYANQN